jgi:hypothetical protein
MKRLIILVILIVVHQQHHHHHLEGLSFNVTNLHFMLSFLFSFCCALQHLQLVQLQQRVFISLLTFATKLAQCNSGRFNPHGCRSICFSLCYWLMYGRDSRGQHNCWLILPLQEEAVHLQLAEQTFFGEHLPCLLLHYLQLFHGDIGFLEIQELVSHLQHFV